ncbi:bifunctional DNA-formamidopyrimidine glycosylase/DNA-(apurinic or apyrimidinic site) lyase [Pseudobdellovibrio exovorus]|uniref:Formamidopyrimidine-DNA glycosylase n=1 Tax=Pseudobdellovibrio exovorus JSS TaxID=1184267 RepID=M4V898_9BACT|nr:bifunctional DNA-formamidopyrimidine glycosylase/DNA-(apurinic or apyrimidinic site) lyase [Pseudobdellovibrio exovorus]AGH95612.1 hypothetical protein A11Q_1396 [Pseudobdellovibrio exovorus JSS]
MPELPEVEIVCRNLREMIPVKTKIKNWEFYRKDLRYLIPKKDLQKLIGLPLQAISRRAKYILFEFQEFMLISHLGMTGSWRLERKGWDKRTHDHLAFELSGGRWFVYEDARRFGFVEVIRRDDYLKRFQNLGAEPLDRDVDFSGLTEKFSKLSAPIKCALMNQKLLVGVGNIYASEILFKVGVSPLRPCVQIKSQEYDKIWKETRMTLLRSIEKGGSTIENYRNSYGESGNYQNEFFVYGKEGESCHSNCGGKIRSIVQAGRSTYWCPVCQKK